MRKEGGTWVGLVGGKGKMNCYDNLKLFNNINVAQLFTRLLYSTVSPRVSAASFHDFALLAFRVSW